MDWTEGLHTVLLLSTINTFRFAVESWKSRIQRPRPKDADKINVTAKWKERAGWGWKRKRESERRRSRRKCGKVERVPEEGNRSNWISPTNFSMNTPCTRSGETGLDGYETLKLPGGSETRKETRKDGWRGRRVRTDGRINLKFSNTKSPCLALSRTRNDGYSDSSWK